ncbi:MAG: hypothetical protein V1913_15840 [Fibrobacterota bacterium]
MKKSTQKKNRNITRTSCPLCHSKMRADGDNNLECEQCNHVEYRG